jgi:hypothetical protein
MIREQFHGQLTSPLIFPISSLTGTSGLPQQIIPHGQDIRPGEALKLDEISAIKWVIKNQQTGHDNALGALLKAYPGIQAEIIEGHRPDIHDKDCLQCALFPEYKIIDWRYLN